MNMCTRSLLFVTFILSAVAMPAAAQLVLSSEVLQEKSVTTLEGTEATERVVAARIVPGSEVIYVLRYRNEGAQAADKVVISNPIPAELGYRGASAEKEGARFEVSADGGKQFGALSELSVMSDDGDARAAQADDVTHVRWLFDRPLAAGETGTVTYRAVVK